MRAPGAPRGSSRLIVTRYNGSLLALGGNCRGFGCGHSINDHDNGSGACRAQVCEGELIGLDAARGATAHGPCQAFRSRG